MNTTLLAVFGITSGVLNLIGLAPYILDIFRKKTQPERATWWIWSVLNFIALAALIDAGAGWQLAMNAAQTISVTLIAFLSLKYGFGKFHKKDFISLIIALAGVALWRFTHQPILALLIVVAIDALGTWLTVTKTWKAPHTETYIAWVIASVSAAFGVMAVGEWSFTKLLYPLYIALADTLLTVIIFYRRPLIKNRG